MSIPAFYETPGGFEHDLADQLVETTRNHWSDWMIPARPAPPEIAERVYWLAMNARAADEDAAWKAIELTEPDRWGTLMWIESVLDAPCTPRSVACRWDWPEPDRHPGADRPCP